MNVQELTTVFGAFVEKRLTAHPEVVTRFGAVLGPSGDTTGAVDTVTQWLCHQLTGTGFDLGNAAKPAQDPTVAEFQTIVLDVLKTIPNAETLTAKQIEAVLRQVLTEPPANQATTDTGRTS